MKREEKDDLLRAEGCLKRAGEGQRMLLRASDQSPLHDLHADIPLRYCITESLTTLITVTVIDHVDSNAYTFSFQNTSTLRSIPFAASSFHHQYVYSTLSTSLLPAYPLG